MDWNLDGLFPFAVLLPLVNLLFIWIVKNRTFLFEIMLGRDCQILKLRNKFRKQIDRHMRHPVLEPYFKCVHENVLSVLLKTTVVDYKFRLGFEACCEGA